MAAEDLDADAGNGLNELFFLLDGPAFHHFDVVSGHGVLWNEVVDWVEYRVLRMLKAKLAKRADDPMIKARRRWRFVGIR